MFLSYPPPSLIASKHSRMAMDENKLLQLEDAFARTYSQESLASLIDYLYTEENNSIDENVKSSLQGKAKPAAPSSGTNTLLS
jgi:hypothetical protein